MKNCEDERLSLHRNQPDTTNLRSLNLIIWYHGSIAGSISLKNLDSNNQIIEIGHWLGTNYTSKGIMTRTVKRLCTLFFTKYKIRKINIFVVSDNLTSNQVPHRAGFYLEAKL
ncbi:GNAT family N-acetyltransferase [uncultured Weissella sp.]|uniref:GNAT family N-acetyltransferase n=1 Tax=uncultured Weissella sp. TaxID=253243 RepID=UPI00338E9D1B